MNIHRKYTCSNCLRFTYVSGCVNENAHVQISRTYVVVVVLVVVVVVVVVVVTINSSYGRYLGFGVAGFWKHSYLHMC